MDLSDLWLLAPSQLFRAVRETCSQFGARRRLVLFGLPDTLHPAYMSAFNAVLPDVCSITNRLEAEILVCAKPSCNVWREQRISGVV
eukprot:12236064-Alexandrium_andersonii.AAC.1